MDPTGTGTRRAAPVRRPSNSGSTFPMAAAAPEEAGIVDTAHLVTAEGGGLILVLAGVPEPARDGVAAAVAEAVRLGGLASGWLDVAFLDPGSVAAEAAGRAGIRLDLPVQKPAAPVGPGMDPGKPPKLR